MFSRGWYESFEKAAVYAYLQYYDSVLMFTDEDQFLWSLSVSPERSRDSIAKDAISSINPPAWWFHFIEKRGSWQGYDKVEHDPLKDALRCFIRADYVNYADVVAHCERAKRLDYKKLLKG